jgi:hypothetical protein
MVPPPGHKKKPGLVGPGFLLSGLYRLWRFLALLNRGRSDALVRRDAAERPKVVTVPTAMALDSGDPPGRVCIADRISGAQRVSRFDGRPGTTVRSTGEKKRDVCRDHLRCVAARAVPAREEYRLPLASRPEAMPMATGN